MRQDSQAVEAFWELFSSHTYGLGPFSEKDTFAELERLSSGFNVNVKDVSHEIVRLSGGHPAILRAIILAFRDSSLKSFGIDEVLQVASVYEECRKVWNALSPREQGFCQAIARKLPLPSPGIEVLNELRFKGVVVDDSAGLFSPVFAAYVQRNTGSNILGVVVNVSLREVRLDGLLLEQSLPPLEFKLIE